ncbi:MAG: hypothetical protein PHU68_00670 [Paludibacter sp.]|nr:hypothetical protein [Paludibacter sp.]
MKKFYAFNRMLLFVSVVLLSCGLHAQNNFYAWDMTTARPGATDGMACGALGFTETDITIEMWLNISTENFTSGVTIVSTRHDGVKGFSLDVSNDGRLRGFFRNDNGDKLNGRTDFVFPFFFEKADIVDKWVHIAIVFSSTDNVARSYLNGEVYQDLVKSEDPYLPYEIGWIGNATGAMRLGYWYEAKAKLNAKIADFRIWSVGRTDEQIKANYTKNLTGTYEEHPGLYLNYRFYTYERGLVNDANPTVTTNKAWCNPETDWNTYYKRETLSAYPENLTVNDQVLSWDTGVGEWEVSFYKSADDTNVFTDTISTNQITVNEINALTTNTSYYAKVRTLNTNVWSGQVTSEAFTVSRVSTGVDNVENQTKLSVNNGTLIIHAEFPQTLAIYTVNGQLIRSVKVVAGENTVSNLSKGLYLVNNQKVVVR